MIKKLQIGKYLIPVDFDISEKIIKISFPFHRPLIDEIKAMNGAKWNPEGKFWTVTNNQRNQFTLAYLSGENVYKNYDCPLIEWNPEWETEIDKKIPFFTQQKEMILNGLTRKYVIFACEMGTGKTRSALKIINIVKPKISFWIGPKATLRNLELEIRTWKYPIVPTIKLTYESFVKLMKTWTDDAPQLVVFDESSKCKNQTSQRSQAAQYLADCIREEWGDNGYVIEMSGSPAPKDPCDWYSQAEIARPGYLREGTLLKFKNRLAIIETRESITGGMYPHLVSWRDDERKCTICGRFQDHPIHSLEAGMFDNENKAHNFVASKNEIHHLYNRLKGLVYVKLKKDCLDLPDKIFKIIRVEPTTRMQNFAAMLEAKAQSAIQLLTLQRELSDGFQYMEVETDKIERCTDCNGFGEKVEYTYIGPEEEEEKHLQEVNQTQDYESNKYFIKKKGKCHLCNGKGSLKVFSREAKYIGSPKEDILKELLDEYEDVGRVVTFAGFTGSINNIINICKKEGWEIFRVDGRGWYSTFASDPVDMLEKFRDKTFDKKIAFIGHPGSAGMGLNLTASPVQIYYSNDFNGENRIQSIERGHRPGMDLNKGLTIIDIFCLPTDELVYNNLQNKIDLQKLTLNDVKVNMKEVRSER